MDASSLALVGGAALAGGLVNAIAGGGSLLTFPALLASGVPPVAASITNIVALTPGYLGATLAQRRDLAGQAPRIARIVPAGLVGGAAGAVLLLRTGDRAFAVLVPFLILLAAVLLALQDRLRAWVRRRAAGAPPTASSSGGGGWVSLPVALVAIYGGYFGAGMGVMLLAALALALDDGLTRLNALKQVASLAISVCAALIFVGRGGLDGRVVAVMAAASLAGGVAGGAVASRVSARVLRGLVVALGLALAAVYLWRR